ncbi:Ger(x)C family spore germination protein [Syntrophomonas wolfei]|jgi:Ger(x)C family germination protein|uniref:Ger(x)C family spore germination protein n=1 Tax=Syntrophomonas wolfei TaxID=863 RepID=UPI0023F21499|nr:Ger(x)C family spore germination protein [Syntrophomonas wolfei]
MPRRLLLFIVIFLLPSCSACWDIRELNNSAVCTGAGVELSREGKFIFSGQMVKPSAPSESGTQTSTAVVLSASGSGVADAARRFMLSLSRFPEWSSISTFVIGEELAREDLALLVDFLLRNRNPRPTVNLVLSRGCTPEEVLSLPMPLSPYSGKGLETILDLQEKQLGIYVPTNVHEFIHKLTTAGIEPVVPQVSIEEKKLFISGTAVFKGRRIVGSLNETESRGYRWMNARSFNGGIIDLGSPQNPSELVSLEVKQFTGKTTPKLEQDQLKMKITIRAELVFYEKSNSGELLTLSWKEEMERLAAQKIKQEISACIKKSQLLGSDILGWGYILQKHEPQLWESFSANWDDFFPTIESDIEVETLIVNSMLSQKSFRFR